MTKKPTPSSNSSEPRVEVQGWRDRSQPLVARDFPGNAAQYDSLRISMSAETYNEILEHAQESANRELCGVILGKVCRDAMGTWVSAEKSLRGETERQGETHVTYTHKTWEKIYKIKDAQFPDLEIVGWYHTHPGFGVQFSDMDVFIQKNFFPGDTQFALVVDPVQHQKAIIANQNGETPYLRSLWIEGNRQELNVPPSQLEDEPASGDEEPKGTVVLQRLSQIEQRLMQSLQATEQQRDSHSRLFTLAIFLTSLMVAGFIIYMVLDKMWRDQTPPKNLQMVEVPIKIDDEVMMVGIRVEGWKIPDGENLLKKLEVAATDRAFQSALLVLKDQGSPEAKEILQRLEPRFSLTSYLLLTWAIVATLIASLPTVARFLKKGSRNERK